MSLRNVTIAFAAGLAAGAALGLLFAPDSGANTRRKIKDQTDKLSDMVKEKVDYVKGKADSFRRKSEEMSDTYSQKTNV